MKKHTFRFLFCFIILPGILSAQEKTPVTFGKVTLQDFTIPPSTAIDSSSSAVIIADVGNTIFKGNSKGWVSYVFKRNVRIKILDKKAFDLATVKIRLYADGDAVEKLDNVSAFTYNIENGAVATVKMEKRDLFSDRIDKNRVEQKFTLPSVKENSIIEYSYTIISDFYFNIPEWEFQSIQYPTLWSEYSVNIPSLVGYVFSRRGIHPFYIDKPDEGHENYNIIRQGNNYSTGGESMNVSAATVKHRWVIKDVPAFYVENYLTSPENYMDKIDFQLSQTYDGQDVHPVKNTWTKATEDMLKENDFASFVSEPDNNYWLDKPLEQIVKDNSSLLAQAKDIYYYLSANFTCNSYYNKYVKTTLQDVYKSRKGNVGEINLLLTDMLLRKNIVAAPVVLSTRDFGFNFPSYPLLSRLNYVICKATIDDKVYYLDATRPGLGFGLLPLDCYNGHARVIDKRDSSSVYFMADSLKERSSIFVRVISPEGGKGKIEGVYEHAMGNIESYNLRRKIVKEGEEKYRQELQETEGEDMKVTDIAIDSLRKYEDPIKLRVDFTIKSFGENDIIYFNPIIWSQLRNNPFKAAVRKYPVEMPYPVNETYVLTMEIPEGYVVEEMPKSTRVSYNVNQGSFDYLIQKTENMVQLRCSVLMKKANFDADEYDSLREFFSYVVKKQNEQIVFKKKSK
ncbi:MAG: DUF3858 domain-containing protein [Chitinophagaceae bacterium]